MTNYREILRLDSLGLNKTQIAEAYGCSRTTAIQTLLLAKENRLQYPLPDSMSDKQLADLLFPTAAGKPAFRMPDYEYVHRKLQKNGVTLNLLWLEYCDACRSAGEICTPQSKYQKQGFFWCDITTIQAVLLNQYETAIIFFRLEGRLMVAIGWKDLKPLLNINCMRENIREGTHWKLHIYTDHISVSGNATIIPVAMNHYKENDK